MAQVLLIQLQSGPDAETNLAVCRRWLESQVINSGALVLLPENALVFGGGKDYLTNAEQLGRGPIQQELGRLAAKYQCYLVCGSFPILSDEPNRVYTSCLVFNPLGQLETWYHKLHLFDVDVADGKGSYRESSTFKPGDKLSMFNLGNIRVGLTICYDLRFPEMFHQLALEGAQVILVPAAFTYTTGAAHWLTLLKARAIENQVYIVAANQGGEHANGRKTWGHSCIIDPWGDVVETAEFGEAMLAAELDVALIDGIRRDMPVATHARFEPSWRK